MPAAVRLVPVFGGARALGSAYVYDGARASVRRCARARRVARGTDVRVRPVAVVKPSGRRCFVRRDQRVRRPRSVLNQRYDKRCHRSVVTYNDPLNKTDPTGLRPKDDGAFDVPGCFDTPVRNARSAYAPSPPATPISVDPGGIFACGPAPLQPVPPPVVVADSLAYCVDQKWAITVRVVSKVHNGQAYAVLKVEPSGWARWNASADHIDGGDQPWKSTWECATMAINSFTAPAIFATEASYRSQYYCHAYGSVGIPGTGKWTGGTHWDLEGWRGATWNTWTWVYNRCNW